VKKLVQRVKEDKKKRWLLLIPFVTLAFLLWFQSFSVTAIEQLLLREKAHERRQQTEFIHAVMDIFIEMDINTEHRGDLLIRAVAYIESNFDSTFAQVYNEQLDPLIDPHDGVGGGRKHDPRDYPEFVNAVRSDDAGDLVYWYETPQAGGRDIYMTFRWMPTDEDNPEPYLVAIGISKYSLTTHIPMVFEAVVWAMIFAVTFTMLLMFSIIIRQTVRTEKYKTAILKYVKGAEQWNQDNSTP